MLVVPEAVVLLLVLCVWTTQAHHCHSAGIETSLETPSWCSRHNPYASVPDAPFFDRESEHVDFQCAGDNVNSSCSYVLRSQVVSTDPWNEEFLVSLLVGNQVQLVRLSSPSNVTAMSSFPAGEDVEQWSLFSETIPWNESNITSLELVTVVAATASGNLYFETFSVGAEDVGLCPMSMTISGLFPSLEEVTHLSTLVDRSSSGDAVNVLVAGGLLSGGSASEYAVSFVPIVLSGTCHVPVPSRMSTWTVTVGAPPLGAVQTFSHHLGLNHSDTSSLLVEPTSRSATRNLVVLHDLEKVLVVPYSEKVDLTVAFGNAMWDTATFYESSSQSIRQVQMFGEGLRRPDWDASNCMYYVEPESQGVFMSVIDWDPADETEMLSLDVYRLEEFERMANETTIVDETNYVGRVACTSPMEFRDSMNDCVNRSDVMLSMPLPVTGGAQDETLVGGIQHAFFGLPSSTSGSDPSLSLSKSVCLFARSLAVDSGLALQLQDDCDGLGNIEETLCDLESLKAAESSVRSVALRRFLYELVVVPMQMIAPANSALNISRSMTSSSLLVAGMFRGVNASNGHHPSSTSFLELLNLLEIPGVVSDAVVLSPNGMHIFVPVSRELGHVNSMERAVEVCALAQAEVDSLGNSRMSSAISSLCSSEGGGDPHVVDQNDFLLLFSSCSELPYLCPTFTNEAFVAYPSAGKYHSTPLFEVAAEAGYYGQGGRRILCPPGMQCPHPGMSAPLRCSVDPSHTSSCATGSSSVALCPPGFFCPTTSLVLPVPPGYKQKWTASNAAELVECLPGEWCPAFGVAETTGEDMRDFELLCPAGTYCEDASALQPQLCEFNATAWDLFGTDHGFSEYCPAGTSGGNRLCPAGSFCLGPRQIEACEEGWWCPEGSFVPLVCPNGYYCETPALREPCPPNNYCPQGSVRPRPCAVANVLCLGTNSLCFTDKYSLLYAALIVIYFVACVPLTLICVAFCRLCRVSVICAGKIKKTWEKKIDLTHRKTLMADVDFENVSATSKANPLADKLLDGLSGSFRAGRTVAVMGPSGCGKSTFVRALAGRAFYADVTGSVSVNGKKRDMVDHIRVLVGFSSEELKPNTTVEECLYFSSRTRVPCESLDGIISRVENVIRVLDLGPVRTHLVHQISEGEKKRLSFGLELVADPMVLFADEVTSGSDASQALEICSSLRRIAHLGTNVVAAIHQPRFAVFAMFDDVLLLVSGGRCAYSGPVSKVCEYFAHLGFPLPSNENPADFLLDVLSSKVPNSNDQRIWEDEEFVEAWKSRPAAWVNKPEPLHQTSEDDARNEAIDRELARVTCLKGLFQFPHVLKREFVSFLRAVPSFLLFSFIVMVLGLFLGVIFATRENFGEKLGDAYQRACMQTLAILMIGMLRGAGVFGPEKMELYFVENRRGLTSFAYFCAQQVIELLYCAAIPFVFTVSMSAVSRPVPRFERTLMTNFCMTYASLGLGYLMGLIFRSSHVIASASIALILVLFGGMGAVLEEMETNWPVPWIAYLSFPFYSVSMLFVEEVWGGHDAFGGSQLTEMMGDAFGYEGRLPWMYFCWPALLAFGLAFRLLTFVLLQLVPPHSKIALLLSRIRYCFVRCFTCPCRALKRVWEAMGECLNCGKPPVTTHVVEDSELDSLLQHQHERLEKFGVQWYQPPTTTKKGTTTTTVEVEKGADDELADVKLPISVEVSGGSEESEEEEGEKPKKKMPSTVAKMNWGFVKETILCRRRDEVDENGAKTATLHLSVRGSGKKSITDEEMQKVIDKHVTEDEDLKEVVVELDDGLDLVGGSEEESEDDESESSSEEEEESESSEG